MFDTSSIAAAKYAVSITRCVVGILIVFKTCILLSKNVKIIESIVMDF